MQDWCRFSMEAGQILFDTTLILDTNKTISQLQPMKPEDSVSLKVTNDGFLLKVTIMDPKSTGHGTPRHKFMYKNNPKKAFPLLSSYRVKVAELKRLFILNAYKNK